MKIVIVRGAGESAYVWDTLPGRMLANFDRVSPVHTDSVISLAYPASIGPINSTPNPLDWKEGLDESVKLGVNELDHIFLFFPNEEIVLIGYSLGAMVISHFLESYSKYGSRIKEVVLIANPCAPLNNGRVGIAGQRNISSQIRSKITEIRNWDDIICSVMYGSALTTLPYFVAFVTGGMKYPNVLFWQLIKAQVAIPTIYDYYQIYGYLNHTTHERDYLSKPEFQKTFNKALAGVVV